MAKASARKRIRELIEELNAASEAYYAQDREIMDNYTYDKLYDELAALESASGIHMSDSPTTKVGYAAVKSLPETAHEQPMLSLDKTKDIEVLRSFIGKRKTLLSWKMDGLTIVLTYRGGNLDMAVTRGNGITGEVVTNNARVFKDLPVKIPFEEELVIRGEAYITYSDFEAVNSKLGDVDAKYKNPRNLCSGSVRQLDSRTAAERNIRFKAFALVKAEGMDFSNSHEEEFVWLDSLGFDVVEFKTVTDDSLDTAVEYFSENVKINDFPSDGLVALYDDIAYGASLGRTAKSPRNSLAFKWADEVKNTRLLEVEWSPSRTGLINPIAVFEPVELEGTTVSRASLHNVSIVRELELGIGDEISVYKANMIIPQVARNITKSGGLEIPKLCPACLREAKISGNCGVMTLVCENPACPAKAIKSFELFAGRGAMDIEGLSESTLEKLMAHGLIHTFADLFRLGEHRDIIVKMDGFGEKSYENLTAAAEKSKNTTMAKLLYALGIPGIGSANARIISEYFGCDPEKIMNASAEDMLEIEGIGPVLARAYESWWKDPKNAENFKELLSVLRIEKETKRENNGSIAGKTFVITGSLNHFANRDELRELIVSLGGKVTGSVSSKTDYLINNDISSGSSKNKKARQLDIPIISEDVFLNLVNFKNTGD